MCRTSHFVCAALFAAGISQAGLMAGLATLHPMEDTNAVLHNPDMGWVVYENYPLDPDPHGSSTMLALPEDSFPEVDAAALMFSWQDVEAREGAYDFSRVDAAYDYWQARGKTIQLRMSTESLMFWEKRSPPAGKGVPDYVLARLKPEEKQTRNLEGNTYVVVDARNRYYRQRLRAFLRAVREHFDARRPVSLIDLRGFGVWGEWHSGFRYPTLEAKRAALKSVLRIWADAFPGQQLALSYSYDPDGPKDLYAGPTDRLMPGATTNYSDYLQYSAFDYALGRDNITFRRDGCGGAVHSNERKLNEEAFRVYHRAPQSGEFLGSYGAIKQGGSNWVTWVVEDALSLHPNYLNLIGWQAADARTFIRERPDLLDRGMREMGYRFVPVRIAYTADLTSKAPLRVEFNWVNRGVGRALRDYTLSLALMPVGSTNIAASAEFRLPTREWVKGTAYATRHQWKTPRAPAGEYRFVFSLRDSVSGRTIALPLTSGSPAGYEIGLVHKLDLSSVERTMN